LRIVEQTAFVRAPGSHRDRCPARA